MHEGVGTTSSQLPGAFYVSHFSNIGKRQTQKDAKTLPLLASLWTCTQPKSSWDYLSGSPDNLTVGSLQGHPLQDTLQKAPIDQEEKENTIRKLAGMWENESILDCWEEREVQCITAKCQAARHRKA